MTYPYKTMFQKGNTLPGVLNFIGESKATSYSASSILQTLGLYDMKGCEVIRKQIREDLAWLEKQGVLRYEKQRYWRIKK